MPPATLRNVDGREADTWMFTYNLNNQVTSAKEYSADSTTSTLLTQIDYGYDVFGDMISHGRQGTMTTEYAYDVSNATIGISDQVNPLYAELSGGTITDATFTTATATWRPARAPTLDGTAWLLTDYQGRWTKS